MELQKDNPNSITLKKGAKDVYSWEIKIYFDTEEANTLKRIEEIDNTLKAKWGG